MAPETRRGVKRKQATTEEETTATKSKTQTRVAKGKQPTNKEGTTATKSKTQTRVAKRKQATNKEETTATKSKTQAVGEAAKGKGKGSVAARGKGKGTVAAKGKGKGTVAAKGKGKVTVAAKGKGETTREKSGSPNSPFNPASHSYVSTSDSTDVSNFSVHQLILFYSTIIFTVNCVSTTFYFDEDYYDTDDDDDHNDDRLDRVPPSKEEVMETALNKIDTIRRKGVGDAAYSTLITRLKRLQKFKDTPPEEVYQAAVDLMSSKKKRVTVTEEKVTELVNMYVNLRVAELAVVIMGLQNMRDWDMDVAIFVKEMAEKYLKLLKLKLPRLEKLYDTADEVTKLKEGSQLFPGAIKTLRLYIFRWVCERFDDYYPKMRGLYDLEHIC